MLTYSQSSTEIQVKKTGDMSLRILCGAPLPSLSLQVNFTCKMDSSLWHRNIFVVMFHHSCSSLGQKVLKHCPQKINGNLVIWNHNKWIQISSIWELHFLSQTDAVCIKKFHSSSSNVMQLAYAKIIVYCNSSLATFHLSVILIWILPTETPNIFKCGIPWFRKSGCIAPTLHRKSCCLFLIPSALLQALILR